MAQPIYLDYNGTTPLDPRVKEAMRPFWDDEFGNPSSTHWYGIKPKQAVARARKQVASLLNCHPGEFIFTSGGTESNNHVLKGAAFARPSQRTHIITSQIEHPAILEVCAYLDKFGVETTFIPVDAQGLVNISDIKKAVKPETALISIMHANNEVGTIQPIEEISALAKENGIIMHTDAAQSVGKISVDVAKLGVDLLSLAGHKVYAPKGIGALFIRNGVVLDKFMHGAGQERGFRAGTENVMQIVGLGEACEIAKKDMEKNKSHMQKMKDLLYEGLKRELTQIRYNGHPEKCLPNTLNLSFFNLEADRILEEIGLEVAASAGAACHSDSIEISHVLKAMGVSLDWAKGTIRFSTGKMTTETEIHRAVEVVSTAVKRLRNVDQVHNLP
ncbi:MAG: cysteine desulfurase [Deltaproteobacteria bacterium]|nr:cysteine desulfurase [Deltaproteobacteria bacterium]MBW2050764.1 cysteine desulfurase [Deltaproteobacteria bacterium]MBW2321976.1 cysteine desulfurase [Deltaproteobacteria bacterium]